MPHQCTNCGRTFDDGSKEMLSGCPDCGGNKFQFQPSGSGTDRAASPAAESAETATESADPPPEATDSTPASGQTEAATDRTEAGDDRTDAVDEHSHPTDDRADPVDDSTETVDGRGDVEQETPEFEADAERAGATDSEFQTSTGEENEAQRDARSAATTKAEIEEARRKMADTEEHRSDVDEADAPTGRAKRGRGAPQGPPPEPPDEEAAEEFSLSGAVGPPEDQPDPSESDSDDDEGVSEEEPIDGPETDLSALREELNDQFESIKITAPGQYELNLMELYDRKEYIISLQEDGRYVVDIAESHHLDE